MIGRLLVLALLVTGCGDPRSGQEAASSEGIPPPAHPAEGIPPSADPPAMVNPSGIDVEAFLDSLGAALYGEVHRFEGTLPCAGCPGIHAELTLVGDNSTYLVLETYLEAIEGRDVTVSGVGIWTRLGGDPTVESGAVLQVGMTPLDPIRFYRVLHPDTLRLMDRSGAPISSALPFELVRVGPVGPAPSP